MPIVVALIALMLTAAAHAAPDGIPDLPREAFAVQDYTVPGSQTQQAYFKVRSEYPRSAIVRHYQLGVSPEWVACAARGPAGWHTFADRSQGAPRFVHEVVRYWVNEHRKKMLTLIVRHYSEGETTRCRPEDDVQHGIVSVSVSPDPHAEAAMLRLQCGVRLRADAIPPPASCALGSLGHGSAP